MSCLSFGISQPLIVSYFVLDFGIMQHYNLVETTLSICSFIFEIFFVYKVVGKICWPVDHINILKFLVTFGKKILR